MKNWRLWIWALLSIWSIASCAPANSDGQKSSADATAAAPKPSLEIALNQKNLKLGDPIFLRIIKTKSGTQYGVLQAFVAADSGQFVFLREWEICNYSGALGPKIQEGDRQSPEGFYFVNLARLNPNSQYHLSFNLGFPNSYDRAHGRTGSFLMVHGDCVSIGCYAMTDDGIEEIYTLLAGALNGGQPYVRVHAFPFPMTADNLGKHVSSPHIDFWRNLKTGWDWFETHQRPPKVSVKNKKYVFGAPDP